MKRITHDPEVESEGDRISTHLRHRNLQRKSNTAHYAAVPVGIQRQGGYEMDVGADTGTGTIPRTRLRELRSAGQGPPSHHV